MVYFFKIFKKKAELSENQEHLIKVIRNALLSHDATSILYFSEWLGHLPFGLYHWITVNGEDFTNSVQSPDTLGSDLEQLFSSGKLIEVDRKITNFKDVGPDDVRIEYKLSE